MTTRKTAYPDTSTAIAISEQMLQSIRTIKEAIPGIGDGAKSKDVATELLPLIDASKLIGLRVVTQSLTIASDLAKLVQSGDVIDASGHEALMQGVTSIENYLGVVASGKIGAGTVLYAPTAEMARHIKDLEIGERQEFFLPVDPVYGPNSPTHNEGRFIAEVARYHDEFRQAMKRYESKKDFETINAMRAALVTMETKNPPSNFRMLLSLAISFLDVAMRAGGKIQPQNEILLTRIDQDLSGVIQGDLTVNEGVISWLMLVIGQASQFSARIRAFQEAYELPRLVEDGQAIAIDAQAINSAREVLENVQKSWEKACAPGGDMPAAKTACFSLVAAANALGDYAMKTMAMAMGSLADGIVEGRVAIDQDAAIFGASIIIAMNERIERVNVDPRGGRAAADLLRDRVRMVLSGKRPSELAHESQSQGGHINAILGELDNDLGSVEQIIDQCIKEGAKESKRAEVAKLFTVVQSALSFVSLQEASDYSVQVASHVDRLIAQIINNEEISPEDKGILSESVMMLHRYVSIIHLDAGQAAQALSRGKSLFEYKQVEVPVVEEEGPFDSCSDEELGPIFFEEARQVISDLIVPGLDKLRTNLQDEQTLLDVRRGFHTLKGSSRMVELNNLGMLGQHAEYVLNIYRDNSNNKPGIELIEWLKDCADYFLEAVTTLESGRPARVNPQSAEAVYNNFRDTNVFKGYASLSNPFTASAPAEADKGLPVELPADVAAAANDLAVHIPETGPVIMPAHDEEASSVSRMVEPVSQSVRQPATAEAVAVEHVAETAVEFVEAVIAEPAAEQEAHAAVDEADADLIPEVAVEEPVAEAVVVESAIEVAEVAEVVEIAEAKQITQADQTAELADLPDLATLADELFAIEPAVEEAQEPVSTEVAAVMEGPPVLPAIAYVEDSQFEPVVHEQELAEQAQEGISETVKLPVLESIVEMPTLDTIVESGEFAQVSCEQLEQPPALVIVQDVLEEVLPTLPSLSIAEEAASQPALAISEESAVQEIQPPELPSLDLESLATEEFALPALDSSAPIESAAEVQEVAQVLQLPALELDDVVESDRPTLEPIAQLEQPTAVVIIEDAQDQAAPSVLAISEQDMPPALIVVEEDAPAALPNQEEFTDEIPATVPTPRDEQDASLQFAQDTAAYAEIELPRPPDLLPDIPDLPARSDAIAESIPTLAVEAEEAPATVTRVTETMPESSGEVMVGDVIIPTALYNVFIGEAGTFMHQLNASIIDVVNGRSDSVDYEVMRMAHSIAGMGRTTGLTAITHLAEKVEEWVTVNQDRKLHITPESAAVLADSVEALDAMILGVQDYVEPAEEGSIIARLVAVIAADEHRIAMAEDVRPEITESQVDALENGDGAVSDAGMVKIAKPIVETTSIGESLAESATVQIPETAIPETTAAVTEVARAPEPFRCSTNNEGDGQAAREAGCTHEGIELAQGLPGRDHLIESAAGEPAGGAYDSDEVAAKLAFDEVASAEQFAYDAKVEAELAALAQAEQAKAIVESVSADASWIDWVEIVATKEDDVDSEMFDIFGEEADERFSEIDDAISLLQESPNDKRTANLLKRAVHTLKGSANTAGCRKIGVIFHHLEDIMESAGSDLTAHLVAVLQSGVDAAFAGLSAMRRGRSVESSIKRAAAQSRPDSDKKSPAQVVADIAESSISEGAIGDSSISTSSKQVSFSDVEEGAEFSSHLIAERKSESTQTLSSASTQAMSTEGTQSAATASTERATQGSEASASAPRKQGVPANKGRSDDEEGSLRVSARQLDKIVKTVGEVNITRSRVGMNVEITKTALTGLAMSLERMYGYLRQVEFEAERQMSAGIHNSAGRDSEFDALQMDRFTRLQEMTRRVSEAQNDIMTQQGAAIGAVRDMEDALAGQYVLVSELSSDLDQVRQVRVSNIVPQLKRVVRTACRETGKQAEIYFDADVEIDRGILSRVMGALEHILRNAVAHGIELPQTRTNAGKEANGTIEFRAFQNGSEVVIEVRDDGRGMDTKKIYESALRKGVIKPEQQLSQQQIRELIFEPGFSTANEVTDIAGRGVGLDVVRSDISALGGRVLIESTLGSGSSFILRVPATLTSIAGAAVETNGHMYVVPVSFIDKLVRVSSKELMHAYETRKLIVEETGGQKSEYEFWGMWEIGGAKVWENAPQHRNSIVLMRNDRVAVHVDDIRPAGEFVFRPLGPQITASSGLIGSTISSNGNASLVLDPARVARTLRNAMGDGAARFGDQRKSPLVLVVDDSTTVRKVTARLLKKEGLRHAEAENGMKALEMIQQEMPAVILMDIEMPVMNGYEATQAIRATAATAHIPIIMITSRSGESHREYAVHVGVNEYLGKPYNEADLIGLIHKYTEAAPAAASA